MKFIATLFLVLTLSGCALTDMAEEYFTKKVNEAVEKGKQTAQQEIEKQVDTAVDTATGAAKDALANQINTAHNQLSQKGQELVKDITATATPKATPTAGGQKSGNFLYLQYSTAELARAKTEKVLLFFNAESNWALDKYFTVTEDQVKNNITVLRVDSAKDQSLRNKYNPGNGDVVIQVDATGKEIARIQGEPYSTTPFLVTIDGKVK